MADFTFHIVFLSYYYIGIFKLFFSIYSTDIKYSNGFILILCFQLYVIYKIKEKCKLINSES